MKNETANSHTLIKAIASGNISQMNKATGEKDKIAWEDLEATFYYLIHEGKRTSFYNFYPPLQKNDIHQMAEGLQIGESTGYKDVSDDALDKLVEVLDCYERLKANNQLDLLKKYLPDETPNRA